METAMINEVRDALGQFAPKSEVPRKVRSVNLTDDAWQWLAAVAKKAGVSRNDYLEALAEASSPLMETVSSEGSPLIEMVESDDAEIAQQPESDISPLMEMVSHALTTPEEALAHAAIFGFTPEEALADAHFQISMLTSNYDELEHRHDKMKRELAKLYEQLETERTNREEVEAEREDLAQLKKQTKEHALEVHREGRAIEAQKDRWQGELSEARADLAAAKATINQLKGKIVDLERGYTLKPNPAERRLRLEIGELQAQLSDLKQKLAAAGKDLPEAAELLNQLKAKRKKSKADLTDLEAILEILES